MYLQSWGLIYKDSDKDEKLDNKDICKNRAFRRSKLDEVVMNSQP